MLGWFSKLKEGLDFLKEGFEKGINSLGESIGKFFGDLGKNIGELFSNLGTNIGQWFTDLGTNLNNLLSYINPLNENFLGYKIIDMFRNLFYELFVPQEDYFTSLSNKFKSKFGFIDQLSTLVNTLFTDNSSTQKASARRIPPNWSITYFDTTVNIIDWSAFEEYRGFLHSIINFILWASFIIRLFRRVPGYINAYYVEGNGKES